MAAIPQVVSSADMTIVVRDSTDAYTTLIADRPLSFFGGYGYFTRFTVFPEGETSEVRVVSIQRGKSELTGTARRGTLEVLTALDQALGPSRIAAYDGMEVRGRSDRGDDVQGLLVPDGTGGFHVDTDTGGRTPIDLIADLEVHRGSHGRALEGGVIGTIIGTAVGYLLADECRDLICPIIPTEASIGSLAGSLLGLGLGSRVRKEFWSPMGIPEEPGRSAKRTERRSGGL